MYLLNQNSQLEVARGTNKTTNEMIVTVSAIDYNQTTGALVSYLSDIITSTNGTTAVTICGAPATGNIREVFRIEINNQDTVQDTIELIESVSAVNTVIKNPIPIPLNNSLNYENNEGWYLTDANGNVIVGVGNLLGDVTGPSSANTVVKINGNPLGSTTPTAGNVLLANGTQWVSTTLSGDVISVSSTGNVVIGEASGGGFKAPVVWSMQTPLSSNTYNNGASGVGATLTATANGALVIGGVTVSVGDRMLIAGEATSVNNGIYSVTQPGSGSTPYILTRATDFNSTATIIPASIIPEVDNATDLQPMAVWTLRANKNPITVGTSGLSFFRILPNFTQEAGGNIFQWDANFNAIGNPMSGDATITATGVVSVNGVSGGAYKAPVDWSTIIPLPSNTYNNGASGVGATLTATANNVLTINSVAVSLNDRILVAGEATSANNGIYSVTQTGSGIAPYILTRTTDFDSSTTMVSASIIPEVVNANDTQPLAVWIFHNGTVPITVGTSGIIFARIIPNFTQFSSGNIFQWDANRNAVGNPMSGDATITNAGVVSVLGLNGSPMTLEGTTQRVFRSALNAASAALTNGTTTIAYFVYLGKTVNSITPKFVEGFCVTAGAGVTSIEVGLFSSPNPPDKTTQTLTKLASATVTSFAANTVFRNATAMSTAVNAGVQLWAGIRVAFSTTAPTYAALAADFLEGYIEIFASAGTFASTASYAATIPATATFAGALAHDLRATLD